MRPPNSEEVAKRLLVLKQVVVYALMTPPREMLKQIMASWSAEDRAGFETDTKVQQKEYWSRLGKIGIESSITPAERQILESTAVTMTHQQQAEASWRAESAMVLAWSLYQIQSLPSYDEQADHDFLKNLPPTPPKEFIRSSRLRPAEEINAARNVAEMWHWRARTRQMIESGQTLNPDEKMIQAGFLSFDDIVRVTAKHAEEEGTLPFTIDEDFPARGKAYRNISVEEWSEISSITYERHFTLNWLCGYAPKNRWDETPTDT